MLFPRTVIPSSIQTSEPLLPKPSSWVDSFKELFFKDSIDQPLFQMFYVLSLLYSRLNRDSSPEDVKIFCQLNTIYEGKLKSWVTPIEDAFSGKITLFDALARHFRKHDSENHIHDDADILFSAVLGLDIKGFGHGYGRGFLPTPLRHALPLFEKLNLKRGELVCDLGCGSGALLVAGALTTEARFIGIDRNASLIERGQSVVRRRGLTDQITFKVDDLLTGDLPRAAISYLFEPVSEPDALKLVGRILESKTSAVVAYGPEIINPAVSDALKDNANNFRGQSRIDLATSSDFSIFLLP